VQSWDRVDGAELHVRLETAGWRSGQRGVGLGHVGVCWMWLVTWPAAKAPVTIVMVGLSIVAIVLFAWPRVADRTPLPPDSSQSGAAGVTGPRSELTGSTVGAAGSTSDGPGALHRSAAAVVSIDEAESGAPAPRPWEPQVLEALPKDLFGMPQSLQGFLHWNLNTTPESRLRQNRFYQPRIETIAKGLRSEDRKRLAEREAEVAEILQPFCNAARDLEGEHWVLRQEALHEAVERGDFVVVDMTGKVSDAERRASVGEHLDALQLGVMNRDFVYVASSSRLRTGDSGGHVAVIYVTRAKSPRVFELLDELGRLSTEAERAVRDLLQVPR
jgi:hypothetical protein